MKRIMLAALTLTLAAQVMATGTVDLTPAAKQFADSNSVSLPDPFFDNQKQGFNWMVQPGCSAGDHKVGGIAIKCTGKKVDDLNKYVGLVGSTNYFYCTNVKPSDPACQ